MQPLAPVSSPLAWRRRSETLGRFGEGRVLEPPAVEPRVEPRVEPAERPGVRPAGVRGEGRRGEAAGRRRSGRSRRVVVDSRTAPAVGTVTADTPLSAIAAIDGAGRHDFRAGWRDDGRDTLSVPRPRPAGHRGSREPEHRRERGRPRGRGLGRRTR